MNRIELHGPLAHHGTGHMIDVGNPLEAFHALDMQLPTFRREFIEGNYVAIREDASGKFLVDLETVELMTAGTVIHFVPLVEGAANGKGVAKTVLGIAVFAGAMFLMPASAPLIFGMKMGTVGMMLGASLALAGASLLLAPQIKMDNSSKEEDKSFLFSGDMQASGQDFAIPITYGRDRVEPILVSSQIVTDSISVGYNETYNGSEAWINAFGGRDTWTTLGQN